MVLCSAHEARHNLSVASARIVKARGPSNTADLHPSNTAEWPPLPTPPLPRLFCFAVHAGGDVPETLHLVMPQLSLCEHHRIFSSFADQRLGFSPVIAGPVTYPRAAYAYRQVWAWLVHHLQHDPTARSLEFDWVVKIDFDTVFRPEALRVQLAQHDASAPVAVGSGGCGFGLCGPMCAVVSATAAELAACCVLHV